jgi:CRISPR/Cas system-associated exonuclease Cas4 (RecB family)
MLNFDRLIEQHIQKEVRPKNHGRYYPSEIGTCMRKVYYSYTIPRPIKIDLQKIFEVGNIMHDFIAEVLRSEKNPEVKLLDSELPFKLDMKDFVISGRIDDLLLITASDKKLLVEVKSTSNVEMVDEPRDENVMQLQLYMHVMKIHDGVLLYVDKRNLLTRSFTIAYDEDQAAEALNRFLLLHRALNERALPEPEGRTTRKGSIGWMCKGCEWREECCAATPEV